jgi:hypothetical protein
MAYAQVPVGGEYGFDVPFTASRWKREPGWLLKAAHYGIASRAHNISERARRVEFSYFIRRHSPHFQVLKQPFKACEAGINHQALFLRNFHHEAFVLALSPYIAHFPPPICVQLYKFERAEHKTTKLSNCVPLS